MLSDPREEPNALQPPDTTDRPMEACSTAVATAVRRHGILRSAVVAFCAILWGALVIAGCSDQTRYNTMSFVFEGVPKPGETATPETIAHVRRRPPWPKSTPTPVEVVVIPKEKYPYGWLPALLKKAPRDPGGYPDFMAAVDKKLIEPQTGIDSEGPKRESYDKELVLRPEGRFKINFPHKPHEYWLDCSSCHPKPFEKKLKAAKMSMHAIDDGNQCGVCHNKVAFPTKDECARCHSAIKKKKPLPDRVMKDKIVLPRIEHSDTSEKEIPRASFPHLPHRVNFRCYVCHDQLFPMKTEGVKPITMQDIDNGQSCGACHNGKVAFPVTLGTCSRCHY